ncbi:hypothetical protein HSX11_13970 [Oxalobacteraceae bacterium]|nr:hypothetical protein [Oxalobacteraceae bacterium]
MLALPGCGEKKSEDEQFSALKDSYKYLAYKKTSQFAMAPLVDQINKQSKAEVAKAAFKGKPSLNLSVNDGHAAMGLLWLLSMKPDFAIAEADIGLEKLKDKIERYRATSSMAIGMYQKHWPVLAKATSASAGEMLNNKDLAEKMYYEQLTFYMAFGFISLKEKNQDGVRFSFSGLGTLTNIPWLSDVAQSVLLLSEGKIQAGMQRLKAASEDPSMPAGERKYILQVLHAVEKEVGDVDGEFFIVKVFGKVILERILETDSGPFRELVGRLEDMKKKFL